MLQAPIAAPALVQPVALAYLDAATGQRSDAPTYIGDTTLVASLWRTFSSPPLVAAVQLAPPEPHAGRDRRAWAHDLRNTIGARAESLVPAAARSPA